MKYIQSISSLLIVVFLFSITLLAQDPDPNFYIYLSFGQSNMEGQGTIETQDQTVDPRFQVLQAVNCSNLGRSKNEWYPAVPPLTRCYSGLSPADYFGRTMVENLPDSIRVGIINVSVAGSKIELFDKDGYQDYIDAGVASWMQNIINEYDGNPYQYLVDAAKVAQDSGVVKGILLHQGESNTGDQQWPAKVKKIYDDLIADLELDADSVPLLAGEVVNADQGGATSSMNSIIAQLPNTIPNSYVISSSQCTAVEDKLHFTSSGYRKLGKRYAAQMLELYGIEVEIEENSGGTFSIFFEPECASPGSEWLIEEDANASNGRYVTVQPGTESVSAASTDSASSIYIPFFVDTTGMYSIYARVNNDGYDNDSFWVKMDDGGYSLLNGIVTTGWQWVSFGSFELTEGEHELTITYREDGAKLDKINVSNYEEYPAGMGEEALNLCSFTANEFEGNAPEGYELQQNYPNPFNPSTTISYTLPEAANITLKVFDQLGREVASLVDGAVPAGSHQVTFDATSLSSGVYFYRLKSSNGVTIVQKMTLTK